MLLHLPGVKGGETDSYAEMDCILDDELGRYYDWNRRSEEFSWANDHAVFLGCFRGWVIPWTGVLPDLLVPLG
jgi:hypothetical protein